MDARDFWTAVDSDPDLRITDCHEGARPEEDYVEVLHVPTGGASRIPTSEILRCSQQDLFDVMKFRRAPKIMRFVSGDAGSYGELPSVSRSIGPVAIAS